MHGEAEDALRIVFADREVPFFVSQISEGGLEVEGLGVIDSRGDGGRLEAIHYILPIIRILG